MAITTMDQLVDGMGNSTQLFEVMKSFTPASGGAWTSLFLAAGIPGAGTTPSPGVNGAAPTDATSGAFAFTNPTGGDTSYLGHFDATSVVGGTLMIYDRLWHNSGLSPTTVGAQSITAASLTRSTDGIGVEPWLDVYGTLGAGGSIPTISYTNTVPTSGRSGSALGWAASAAANRCFPFTLQAGDLGVTKFDSFNNVGSHTSGTFGLILRKRLGQISVTGTGIGDGLDFVATGAPIIPDDACIEFIWGAISTTAVIMHASYGITQG